MRPPPFPVSLPRLMRARLKTFASRLTIRLLILTLAFVVVIETLLSLPSLAVLRHDYLERVLHDAHLALLALEASPSGLLDQPLQVRLLTNTATYRLKGMQKQGGETMIGPPQSFRVDASFSLDDATMPGLIADAVSALLQPKDRVIAVTQSAAPDGPFLQIEAIFPEAPLAKSLRRHIRETLLQTLFIALAAGIVWFIVLERMLIRPLHRLSAAITLFRKAPEDATRRLRPTGRRDEIGDVERALADMQADLRLALRQRARLAAVGIGVSKISHDLKGILTSALLESDRLELTADIELKHSTKGIARALERALELVASIVFFAKEGPPTPQRKPTLFKTLLQDLQTGLPKTLVWMQDCPEDLQAWIDPSLALRALENLVRNAIDAEAKTIRIHVWREKKKVLLRLSDDGCGLPPKAKENLFAPFAGSARAGGIGLGLPIARELIVDQGGSIELERSNAQGTSFLLTWDAV